HELTSTLLFIAYNCEAGCRDLASPFALDPFLGSIPTTNFLAFMRLRALIEDLMLGSFSISCFLNGLRTLWLSTSHLISSNFPASPLSSMVSALLPKQ